MRTSPGSSLLALFLVVSCPALAEAQAPPPWEHWDGERRVVHEWGTFTAVQGSDGAVLDGLLHEERDLPEFVVDLRDAFGVTARAPKMETPVVYFYAPERWRIAVDVRFPRGLITQWYPAASAVNHQGTAPGSVLTELRDGFITWGGARELLVLAPGEEAPLAPVPEDDPWSFQRDVAANPLRVCGVLGSDEPDAKYGTDLQYERMLFYRGLGDFPLPLVGEVYREELEGDRAVIEAALSNPVPDEPLTGMFLVLVDDGRAAFASLPDLVSGYHVGPLTLELAPLERAGPALATAVESELVRTGLYRDEARAMVRTWEHAWFGDEGLRVLYVLPAAFVDRELPLAVTPHASWNAPAMRMDEPAEPDEVLRTFVGRTELLSPRREARLVRAVHAWADGDATARDAAREEILAWGRFAAPYLERVAALTGDAAVAERVRDDLGGLDPRR